MRLKKLFIRNIATYKRAEIDFDSLVYPVFVTGPNGSGKTTLFVDAITAALYGSAYGMLKSGSANSILRKGTDNGEIKLEFEVNGLEYRIVRKFRGKGSQNVAMEIRKNGKTIKYVTGDKNVRNYVKSLLGMETRGILNSVMVRQGEVEKFLNAKPAERRSVLLEILGLDFSQYKEEAKKMRDDLSREASAIEGQIKILNRDISKKPELENERKELLRKRVEIKRKLEQLKAKKEALEDDISNLEKIRSQFETILSRTREKMAQLNDLKRELEEVNKQLEEIESLERKYGELLNRLGELRTALLRYGQLLAQITDLRTTLKEKRDLLAKWEELDKTTNQLKLYGDLEANLENITRELDTLNEKIGQIDAAIQSTREELDNTLELLEKQVHICPYCGSPITPEKLEERRKNLENKLKKLKDELANLKQTRNEKALEKNRLERKLREKLSLQDRIKRLQSELQDKERPAKAEIEELENRLKQQIMNQKELEENFYRLFKTKDSSIIARRLEELSSKREIIAKKDTLINQRNTLLIYIKELQEELKNAEQARSSLIDINEKLKRLQNEKTKTENEIDMLTRRSGEIEERLKNIANELRDIENKTRELKELQEKLSEIKQDISALDFLINKVFSEGGVPVVLLDNYLKNITLLANEYLSQFGLDIEIELTPRKIKTGHSIDLKAKAEGYERDIKTFSGGEITLIGFAIRLAIGKLIQHISGVATRPKFLIIDEGFGSLDEDKRQMLAEAISGLLRSGEYEQIIVISHQQDLRYSPHFRTIISVKRDEGISKIEILNAGTGNI